MPLKPSSSRRTSFIHFSEPWLGTSSTSGYPAITPSAPDFVIAACQGGRKFSRSERSESSMAPRSRPLVGSLCVGKSVISATPLSGAAMSESCDHCVLGVDVFALRSLYYIFRDSGIEIRVFRVGFFVSPHPWVAVELEHER